MSRKTIIEIFAGFFQTSSVLFRLHSDYNDVIIKMVSDIQNSQKREAGCRIQCFSEICEPVINFRSLLAERPFKEPKSANDASKRFPLCRTIVHTGHIWNVRLFFSHYCIRRSCHYLLWKLFRLTNFLNLLFQLIQIKLTFFGSLSFFAFFFRRQLSVSPVIFDESYQTFRLLWLLVSLDTYFSLWMSTISETQWISKLFSFYLVHDST